MNQCTILLAFAHLRDHHANKATGSMHTAPALSPQALGLADWLERLRCWVLALPQPHGEPLIGQVCDRLRPRFIAVALEEELLSRSDAADATLLTWQWDSRTGQVRGLLLQAGQLQRFHWIPGLQQFHQEALLNLQPRWWPQRQVSS